MSLENLAGLNVQVISSSKKAESLRDATSAIFVITPEDIKREAAPRPCRTFWAWCPGYRWPASRPTSGPSAPAVSTPIQQQDAGLDRRPKRLRPGPGRGQLEPTGRDAGGHRPYRGHPGPGRHPLGRPTPSTASSTSSPRTPRSPKGFISRPRPGLESLSRRDSGTLRLEQSRTAFRYGGKLADDFYYRVYGQIANQNPSVNPRPDPYESALGNAWNDQWNDFRAGFRTDLARRRGPVHLGGRGPEGLFQLRPVEPLPSHLFRSQHLRPFNDINTNIDQNAHILGRWTRISRMIPRSRLWPITTTTT